MLTHKTYKVFESELLEVHEPLDTFATIYSYADYYSWKIKERVELIKGKIFKMSPALSLHHQSISSYLHGRIFNFLENNSCKVFSAPFDVRFVDSSSEDGAITTVLQPDISVICDQNKLDARGCLGAPDLVVEILSPSSSSRDLRDKYDIYETHGVKEYWVIHPSEYSLLIYTLDKSGKYQPSRLFTKGDIITSTLLKGIELDLDQVFDY